MRQITRQPEHPGVVFLEDVLKPLGLSITEAAEMLGVTRKTLSEFVNGKSSLSPEMALRISEATHTSAESWIAMQDKLTLWKARQSMPSNVIMFPGIDAETEDEIKEG
ncbi:MAG: HigA family addiction module antitoxin [Catonella sp.]|nr:HigA family addiction module antitoxin [Catonella sp.]MDY6357177.1 HigA family addiction module antitoxin [Catonella sp.]